MIKFINLKSPLNFVLDFRPVFGFFAFSKESSKVNLKNKNK